MEEEKGERERSEEREGSECEIVFLIEVKSRIGKFFLAIVFGIKQMEVSHRLVIRKISQSDHKRRFSGKNYRICSNETVITHEYLNSILYF